MVSNARVHIDADRAMEEALASPRLAADLASISSHDQPVVVDEKYGTTAAGVERESRGLVAILSRENASLRAQVDDLQGQIRAYKDASRKGGIQPNLPASNRDIARQFWLDGMQAWVSVTPEGTVYMTADQIEQIRRDTESAADRDAEFVVDAQDAIRERDRSEAGYVARKLKQDE